MLFNKTHHIEFPSALHYFAVRTNFFDRCSHFHTIRSALGNALRKQILT